MIKKIICLVTCIAICFCLAGCGADTKKPTKAPVTTESTTQSNKESYKEAADIASKFLDAYLKSDFVEVFNYSIIDFEQYDLADYRKNVAEKTADYTDLKGYYKNRTSEASNGLSTADNFIDAWDILGNIVLQESKDIYGDFTLTITKTEIDEIDTETAQSMLGNSIVVTQEKYADYLDVSQLFSWEMVDDYVSVDVYYKIDGEISDLEDYFTVDMFKVKGEWKVLVDYAPIQ